MKLEAKKRLQASTEDPISDGVVYDTLVDGDPSQEEPIVQQLTNNDGGIEQQDDQELLRDDVVPGISTIRER
jgi:hypothetical protein